MDLVSDITDLIQACVRNRCVNPPGDEMKSVLTINRYLESHGVEAEVLESAPRRGNLFAVIKGSGTRPSLMLGPGHVDVVPVTDPSTWRHPPFGGEIHDDCIWGRGTLDMLFIVACQAAVFANLHQEGFKPKGDLKLLVVSDEEAAGTYGAEWMVENHPDKVKVDNLITEGGGYELSPNRLAYCYGEKGATWLRMKVRGKEQHGSMPFKSDNAVVRMSEMIRRLTQYNTPVTTEHIKVLVEDLPMGGMMKFLVTRRSIITRLVHILSKRDMAQAKLLHAISRMTISPNLCQGGTKINVIAGEACVDVDVRTLPGQDRDYVMHHIQRALGDLASKVGIGPVPKEAGATPSYGNASRVESPLVEAMKQATRATQGDDVKLVPMLMPGATDCRFFRAKWNTQAYGFSLFDRSLEMNELISLIHGTNERVSLGTLKLTSRAYMDIVRRFLG